MRDFLFQGKGHGNLFKQGTGRHVAQMIANDAFDPNLLRPWVESVGRSPISEWCQIHNGYDSNGDPKFDIRPAHLVTNTPAVLPRDSWKIIDETVRDSILQELKFVNQLRGAGLQYVIPNGMSVIALESTIGTDITGATVSMDGVRRGDRDVPEYDTRLIPLPITHKDFSFTSRQVAVSRRAGFPLDTRTSTKASRKVAEEIEMMALGVSGHSGFSYGGGAVYGVTDHPDRITGVLTIPTDVDWTPELMIDEVLAMIQQLKDAGYRGPYRLELSSNWDQYLDKDYSQTYGGKTLRQRLRDIDRIAGIETQDYLEDWNVVLLQRTSDVIRMIIGMDVVTLQWDTHGGMELNFKVMAIMVPEIQPDADGNTGIVHAVAA
jgi:uncharacterized linocin/CFP29 family protein